MCFMTKQLAFQLPPPPPPPPLPPSLVAEVDEVGGLGLGPVSIQMCYIFSLALENNSNFDTWHIL
jgi:hypothetical protein